MTHNPDNTMHPTPETLHAFRRRELPPAEMLSLSDHLCDCERCREQVGAMMAASGSLEHFLGEDATLHLSEDEIADVVADTTLTAKVHDHLKSCAKCQAEVDDARRFAFPPALVTSATASNRAKVIAWPVWSLAAAAGIAVAAFAGYSMHHQSPAPAQLVAELRDGDSQIGLTSQGRLTGTNGLSPDDAALVATSLSSHHLPVVSQPAQTASTMRGRPALPEAFAPLTPVDEITLQAPQLSWQALPDATGYQVFVYNQAFQLVAQSPALTQSSWTIASPLAPGQTYTWVIKATTPTGIVQSPRPPAPEARFTVAGTSTLARIAGAQPSHLLLAILYAQNGMTSLARGEISVLKQENPDSPIVRDLANSLPSQSLPSSTKPAQ
ncbi:MAG TPA: hypothetical protein VFC39_05070 [Acidobacteriaceae bacterium]|nr:hypothetical protein [Acidobacteriaceae bacterium]